MFGTQRAGPALSGAHARQRGTRVVCQCLARRRPCAMASSALSSATRPSAQGGSTSPGIAVPPASGRSQASRGARRPTAPYMRWPDRSRTRPSQACRSRSNAPSTPVRPPPGPPPCRRRLQGHGRRKALLSLRGRHHPRHATGDDHAHRHEHRQASADRHRDHYPTCGETSAPALVDCFAGRGVRPASRSPQPATARRSR
jgi:hypothetical protein